MNFPRGFYLEVVFKTSRMNCPRDLKKPRGSENLEVLFEENSSLLFLFPFLINANFMNKFFYFNKFFVKNFIFKLNLVKFNILCYSINFFLKSTISFSRFFLKKHLQITILCYYFAPFINLLFVITKAGGNRPVESLATSAAVERCYILSLS